MHFSDVMGMLGIWYLFVEGLPEVYRPAIERNVILETGGQVRVHCRV